MIRLEKLFAVALLLTTHSYAVNGQVVELKQTNQVVAILSSHDLVSTIVNEEDPYKHLQEDNLLSLEGEHPKTSKQKIEELDTKELRESYQLFKKKKNKFGNMGLIGLVGGAFFTIAGSSVISNADGFDFTAMFGGALLIGIGVGGGSTFTLIGLLNSANYGQKAKWAREELQRRNEPLARLRISPGYNASSKAGYVSVKYTF
jgi:hypothetical protein